MTSVPPEASTWLPPLAEPPATPRDRFEWAVRDAVTYTSEDLGEGTCGWLLSEDQFAAVFAAGDEFADALVQAHARTPRSQGARSRTSGNRPDLIRVMHHALEVLSNGYGYPRCKMGGGMRDNVTSDPAEVTCRLCSKILALRGDP